MNERKIEEYTVLRGMVTALVVIGHSIVIKSITEYGGYDYSVIGSTNRLCLKLFMILHDIIYSFHMPLFMALSGALFYRTNNKKNLKKLIVNKGQRLIYPFIIICLLWSFPLKYISGYWDHSNSVVRDFAVGQLLIQGNTHLWYLITLFWIFIVAFILEKTNSNKVLKMLLLFFLYALSDFVSIKMISYIMKYLVWFFVGFYFESKRKHINTKINNKLVIKMSCAFFLLFIINRYLMTGELLVIYIFRKCFDVCITAMGCFVVYSIALKISKLSNSKILSDIRAFSEYSFGVYLYSDGLGYLILKIADILSKSFFYGTWYGYIILFFLRTIGSTAGALWIAQIMKRCKIRYLY